MRRKPIGLMAFIVASSGCSNVFDLSAPHLSPPVTGSVAALSSGAQIVWSRVDDADSYVVYFSDVSGDVATVAAGGSVSVLAPPLSLSGLQAGQRYYVAIASSSGELGVSTLSAVMAVEPFDTADFTVDIVVDAGLAQVVPRNGYVGLRLASFLDPEPGADQTCLVEWNDGSSEETPTDPCNTEEGHQWKGVGRWQPVLTVENSSGRIGEAFTTVYVR